MQFYRCKCGKREATGSMSPYPCQGCSDCGTTLETHPDLHTQPKEHDWHGEKVETDTGYAWITRCSWCGVKRPQPDPPHMSDEEFADIESRMSGKGISAAEGEV